MTSLLDDFAGRHRTPAGRSGWLMADPGEALPRPQRIERVTFEDWWFLRQAHKSDFVVPLEQLRPGDRQVAIAWRRGPGPLDSQPVDVDHLAQFPDVESIIGMGEIRLRTPLPHVRELFMNIADSETLANLPNLVRLVGGPPHGHELDPAAAPPGLRDLQGQPFGRGRFEALPELERLGVGFAFRHSAEAVAHLSKLRWLSADFGKGLRHLGRLERLELLSLDVQEGPTVSNLKSLAPLQRLRCLHVNGRRLRSLEGVERLEQLEALFLYRPGITDLSPLAGLPKLSRVRLDGPDRVADFSPLTTLPALEWLRVEFHGHSELEAPELPGVEVGWWKPWQRRAADIEVGPIAVHRLHDGTYSIFQDVTDLLDVQTNHDAEDRVRAEADATLRARLTFDSEGGALSITADTEADIRAAADAILRCRP